MVYGTQIHKVPEIPCQEMLKEFLLTEECSTLDKDIDCNDFSSLQRLLRVTCYVYHFIRNVKYRIERNKDALPKTLLLTVEETNNSRNSWIQAA